MRRPKKALKIYRSIRNDILKRRLPAGTLLAKREVDLAESLNVSRDTLRHALAMLEEEHLIKRIKGKGSFISESIPRTKITVLMPCAGSVSNYSGYLAAQFAGAMEEARKHACEIETIPVSPTNDMTDIDWAALFNLNSESRVMLSSFWFRHVFDFLAQSKCRVALIHDDGPQNFPGIKHIEKWSRLHFKTSEATRSLTEHLFKNGAKQPFFLMRFADEDRSPIRKDIVTACKEIDPEFSPLIVNVPDFCTTAETEKLLLKTLKKHPGYTPDGVLVNTLQASEAVRKHFPGILCGFVDMKQKTDLPADAKTFYSDFNQPEIGMEAVRQLLRPDYPGKEICFTAEIINGNNNINLTM